MSLISSISSLVGVKQKKSKHILEVLHKLEKTIFIEKNIVFEKKTRFDFQYHLHKRIRKIYELYFVNLRLQNNTLLYTMYITIT